MLANGKLKRLGNHHLFLLVALATFVLDLFFFL